jgi:UDP-glucuronate 4-epimerase
VSGELLGHVYSKLFGIRFLALRFFTVYGPRQRPDLAIHKFAKLMQAGRPIPLFGDGGTRRDYTYIDDIVSGIRGAIDYEGSDFEVVNLGNNRTVSLCELVLALETVLGIDAEREWLPVQPGDVPQTWACVEKAGRLFGYAPTTGLHDGLTNFVSWLFAAGEGEPARYPMAERGGEVGATR